MENHFSAVLNRTFCMRQVDASAAVVVPRFAQLLSSHTFVFLRIDVFLKCTSVSGDSVTDAAPRSLVMFRSPQAL